MKRKSKIVIKGFEWLKDWSRKKKKDMNEQGKYGYWKLVKRGKTERKVMVK